MTAHMTMPNSFPFYSSVILESGSFSQWVAQPLSDAETTFQNVLTLTNCTTVSCLTALPAVTLFAAGANIPLPSPALYAPLGWAPTVDDVELKSHPWLLLKDGEVRYDIPVMLGSNKDEVRAKEGEREARERVSLKYRLERKVCEFCLARSLALNDRLRTRLLTPASLSLRGACSSH